MSPSLPQSRIRCDSLGRHGLCYNTTGTIGRIPHHFEVNKILRKSLASIDISSRLEPNGLYCLKMMINVLI